MADLSIDSNLSGSVQSVVSGSFGAIGPVTFGGLPTEYTFDIGKLPKISIGIDPLQSTVTLEPVTLTLSPIQVSLAITEVPSVRVHLPADYCLAVSLFGVEVAAWRLCGEGQVITEPYRPNPCEACGPTLGWPIASAAASPAS
jgi:hypothetical protein